MLIDTHRFNYDEGLARIKRGEILILAGNESTGAIVKQAFHAELVTPGSAVGGYFDREITELYRIGDVRLVEPNNSTEQRRSIKHRQSDVTDMLQFWQEHDPLERAVLILDRLCQQFGTDRSHHIPSNLLIQLTGIDPYLLDRAWDRLLSIEITNEMASANLMDEDPSTFLKFVDLDTLDGKSAENSGVLVSADRSDISSSLQHLPSQSVENSGVLVSADLSGSISSSFQSSTAIKPNKRRNLFGGRLLLLLGGLAVTGTGLLLYTLSNSMVKQPTKVVGMTVKAKQKPLPVSGLGYLEPQGRVIVLSAPAFLEGSRVQQILVSQGDTVKKGAIVAILDNRDRLQSILAQAQQNVKIAEAKLKQVKAGSKTGDIRAQQAKSRKGKAELEGQISSQKAAIANIQAQLVGERGTQEAQILQVRAELQNARTECNRYQTLERDGVISKSQRDNTCLSASTAQARLAQADSSLTRIINTRQKQLGEANANLQRTIQTLQSEIVAADAATEAVMEVRPVDVRLATEEITAAKAGVNKAQADLAQAYVRSPIAGQVLKIDTLPGELVNQQKGIAQLGRTEQMYVNADIYETDISRVHTGQKVSVRADRVIGNLTGYVDRVGIKIGTPSTLGTDPVKEADVRVVEVKIKLIPKDSKKVKNLTNLQVNVAIEPSV